MASIPVSIVVLLLLSHALAGVLPKVDRFECLPRNDGWSSQVCVCNSTYCDTIPRINTIAPKTIVIVTSTKAGDRFSVRSTLFNANSTHKPDATFTVNADTTYQTMLGFGGAFTDAVGINIIKNLNAATRTKLMESYFSPNGIEYTIGRVPIASTDFSTHEYSYDDISGDLSLSHFNLTSEDYNLKIPLLKQALLLSKRPIRLFSTAWSAPAWMKTNNAMNGRGFLKGSPGGPYSRSYANYLVKFLDAYKAQGLPMWGMTVQNEPFDGRVPYFPFQSLGFTPDMERDFIVADLGPALWSSGYKDLKLMILDDDLLFAEEFAHAVYGNATANKYVSGMGVHWYMNGFLSQSLLTTTHNIDPSKFILATEACAGSGPGETKVILGSWERAESYANDIIKDIENYATGWTDWNIALNLSGGPNWVNNDVDSPIIVNQTDSTFYKQPMFYAMGHFSKYIIPDSKRIELSLDNSDLNGVAFSTPEKKIVLLVYNSKDQAKTVQVNYKSLSAELTVQSRSINTLIWNQ